MGLKLYESTIGVKYKRYTVGETPEEAGKMAKQLTGIDYLTFTNREITVPGYVITVRGENESVGASENGDSERDHAEKPEVKPEPAPKPAAKPRKTGQTNARRKKGAGGNKGKSKQNRQLRA
jgi:flagellar biosynthesis GTPase FlhF